MNFGKGHVPGAVTAAYKEKSEPVASFDASEDSFELDKLPKDKAATIVFYSDGPTGWKSYKAAVLSVKAGYKNVMYMRGGMNDWSDKSLRSNADCSPVVHCLADRVVHARHPPYRPLPAGASGACCSA